jgi:hypothetical protein
MKLTVTLLIGLALGLSASAQDQGRDDQYSDHGGFSFRDQEGNRYDARSQGMGGYEVYDQAGNRVGRGTYGGMGDYDIYDQAGNKVGTVHGDPQ